MRTPTHRLARAGVVLIPQGDALFPGLSVRDNLDSGAFAAGWRERKRRRERVLRLFPRLAERLDQAAGTLSGGERRMCSLGRGLMSDARVFLIDEPSLGLAPGIAAGLYSTLRELDLEGGTLVLAEQNQSLLEGWIDRIVRVHGGQIVGIEAGGGGANGGTAAPPRRRRRRGTGDRHMTELVTTVNLAAIYALIAVGHLAHLGRPRLSQPRPRRHVRGRGLRRLVGAGEHLRSRPRRLPRRHRRRGGRRGDHLPERVPAARRQAELALPLDDRLARARDHRRQHVPARLRAVAQGDRPPVRHDQVRAGRTRRSPLTRAGRSSARPSSWSSWSSGS